MDPRPPRPTRTPRRPSARLALLGAGLPVALLAGTTPAVSSAAQAPAGTPAARTTVAAARSRAAAGNPLAGHRMGVYKGKADQAWEPYVKSKGTARTLLGKIALRPKAKWFGAWISNGDIAKKVDQYIANSQHGSSDTLVQMTVFRLKPWEHDACKRLPTHAEQVSYKQWISRFAKAIGNARVALVLQPDGPFAMCVPHHSLVPSHLIGYAAKTFSALPRTSVYIDGGATDWPSDDPVAAVKFLLPAGIKYARGFALNSTHYVATSDEVEFGTKMVYELADRGVPGKHFVVNTAQNGAPFRWSQKRSNNFDNSPVCTTKITTRCVTLGIPPTTDVANPKWGLSALDRKRALHHVDAYLWYGRPWLYMQADPFSKSRALALARTTPY